jgi:hypothetical protein
MEQEPVPATLPSNLIPPSKRRKSGMKLAGAVAVLPGLFGMSLSSAPSPLKETLRPTPSLSAVASLGTPTSGLSPKHSFKSSPQQVLVNISLAVSFAQSVVFTQSNIWFWSLSPIFTFLVYNTKPRNGKCYDIVNFTGSYRTIVITVTASHLTIRLFIEKSIVFMLISEFEKSI